MHARRQLSMDFAIRLVEGQLENMEMREQKREWEMERERKQPKYVENVSQSSGHALAKSLR